jgi:uncharacterized protein
MNKNILIVGVVLIIIGTIALFVYSNSKSKTTGKNAVIHGHTIQLEIADTSEKQQLGLSNRNSLAENSGMLFIFSEASNYSFWMKDMRISIDIIFLKDNKVITIYSNVQPQTGPQNLPNLRLYYPKTPSNLVLEINSGLANKYGLKAGETIVINK